MMQLSLEPLIQQIAGMAPARDFIAALKSRSQVSVVGAVGSLRAVLAAIALRDTKRPILWLFESQESAMVAKEDLDHLLSVRQSEHFPEPRQSKWGMDDLTVITQYAEVLRQLKDKRQLIVLASHKALFCKIRPPAEINGMAIQFTVNNKLNYSELPKRLVEIGFDRQPLVEKPGDFAVRGGILDIFPFTSQNPLRVEFWGNVIESLREFDAASQRSTLAVKSFSILPRPVAGAESHSSLLDHLPVETIVFLDDLPAMQRLYSPEHLESHLGAQEISALQARGTDPWKSFSSLLKNFTRVSFSPFAAAAEAEVIQFGARHQPPFDGDLKRFLLHFERISNGGSGATRNYFLCESPGHARRMQELLADRGLTSEMITVLGLGLSSGFTVPAVHLSVITDHEFYGRIRRQKIRRRFRDGLTLRQLKTISIGDFVVHADHGVGIFKGLEKIKVRESERECLVLEYRDKDKLFVPLDRMDRVQKYSGKDGISPTVHKLGAPDWERLRKRTKSRVKDIARELIQLYAKRKSEQGYAFSSDTTWQKELEASFIHEDTPDQERAVKEVKRDMEASAPMDRLICGDVGYGKTEVAVRAAFKAVQDGKQVAVLVPTTILAEQHLLTFRDRMSRFPVHIEALSRFRSPREQRKIIEMVKSGSIDVIIGTHRLLSKDVEFNKLGLLIIDEEQRFGVRHKEKLKHLRANVDVLTLSATPIPRTLQMSLFGVRDMSQINTPPRDRLPVQTEVMEFDPRFIREAILREIRRGGQVFFVHNRVESIYQTAQKLLEIVPEVEIAVAHGQLRETELEKIMMKFMNRHYHVLVSTMIIESGLDMPNVNTIFINRADRFGLAQLYQLRGRVGRSSQKAYCYLLIPPVKSLTPEAIRRLETIEEFTDLGSGIQIAMRDLEIRGAGNLLGAEQSGFIEAMGIETYLKILEEAVAEIRSEGGTPGENELRQAAECKVEAQVNAFLPETYVALPTERVDIYRRLAHATRAQQIIDIRDELRDRFGKFPSEAENLINLALARILGRLAGLKRIQVNSTNAIGYFAEKLYNGSREHFKAWLADMLQRTTREFEFFQGADLGIRISLKKDGAGLGELVSFLRDFAPADQFEGQPGDTAPVKENNFQ